MGISSVSETIEATELAFFLGILSFCPRFNPSTNSGLSAIKVSSETSNFRDNPYRVSPFLTLYSSVTVCGEIKSETGITISCPKLNPSVKPGLNFRISSISTPAPYLPLEA